MNKKLFKLLDEDAMDEFLDLEAQSLAESKRDSLPKEKAKEPTKKQYKRQVFSLEEERKAEAMAGSLR